MITRTFVAGLAVVVIGAAGVPVASPQAVAPFKGMAGIALRNGPNQVDLDGDGRTDLVFAAWRENFNAHGFYQVAFYRSTTSDPAWQLVPFFRKDDMPDFTAFTTTEGADCRLRDLRMLRSGPGDAAPVLIIVGERPLGESYVTPGRVTFTVYRASRNDDHDIGAPSFYFRVDQTITSTATYCDVGEAFTAELGITSSPL